MEDEDLRLEMIRGQRAAELLEHPLMMAFLEDAERELWKAFKDSGLRDAEGREKIRLMLYWLTKFQTVMKEHLTTGTMATMELQERKTLAAQLKEAIHSVNPWS